MSILSVSTIQSSNTTSDLTIRASNSAASEIVLYANGGIKISGVSPPFFNTNISQQVGFSVTTTLSPAFTAPATAGLRYVIHSIHATNIGASTTDLYVELEGTEYANTTLAGDIPFPVGTTLELLKRPKVLYPNDQIKTRATANSAMHVLITYEISSDTNLFGDSYHVGTGNTTFDAYTATGNSVLESMQLTNYSNTAYRDVTVQTVWVNSANAVQGYFTFNQIVPARGVIEVLGAPKVLPVGHKIQIRASEIDSIDLTISGKLI